MGAATYRKRTSGLNEFNLFFFGWFAFESDRCSLFSEIRFIKRTFTSVNLLFDYEIYNEIDK